MYQCSLARHTCTRLFFQTQFTRLFSCIRARLITYIQTRRNRVNPLLMRSKECLPKLTSRFSETYQYKASAPNQFGRDQAQNSKFAHSPSAPKSSGGPRRSLYVMRKPVVSSEVAGRQDHLAAAIGLRFSLFMRGDRHIFLGLSCVSVCAGLACRVRGALVGLTLVMYVKVGRGRGKCSVRKRAGVCKMCSWVAPGPLVVCAAHFASSVIVVTRVGSSQEPQVKAWTLTR